MIAIVFVVGLAIGSFINVLVDGIIQADSLIDAVFWRRSRCNHCRRLLRWYELIPVLSFIALAGRCLRCKKNIPFRYLTIELTTGFLTAEIFWKSQGDLAAIALVLTLFVMALVDYRTQAVPEVGLQIGFYLVAAELILRGQTSLDSVFIGLLAALAAFAPFVFAGRGEIMGEADLLVAVILGLWLGFPLILVGFAAAFIIGGIVGGFLLATGRKKRADTLGFIPYLVGGGLIAFIFGDRLINFYLGLI